MASPHRSHSLKNTLLLALGALGVVYGDIGTSPLYAMKEIFFGHHPLLLTHESILGVTSVVFWAITLVVTLKYVLLVLRADNQGEGGVFALYGLLKKSKGIFVAIVSMLLILAAGLLFGDGIITPAISVISAIEGLTVATPLFQPYVVPVTIIILTALFVVQKFGTAKIGSIFGPIVAIWFLAIGAIGFMEIIQYPTIIQAFNPLYAVEFLTHHEINSILLMLGSVMLVVTGGEAMYADMGHFGKKPIRISWFAVTYPALILNYFGQGAFLLSGHPIIQDNIFFSMVPGFALYPMILLATLATIIASQALITGAFSLATQAMSFGLIPYLKVIHTHEDHEGQLYVPSINWALYTGCILLVIGFQTSTNLASAYGLAVSGVMLVTTLAMISIAQHIWKWPKTAAITLFTLFAALDFLFLVANSFKILQGGYVPLLIGLTMLLIMKTWQWGRAFVAKKYEAFETMAVAELIEYKKKHPVVIPRSVIIMTPKPITSEDVKAPFLKHIFLERYGAVPQDIVFLTVQKGKTPFAKENRYKVYPLFNSKKFGSISGVTLTFGFMEEKNVEAVLSDLAQHKMLKLPTNPEQWSFHVAHERVYVEKEASTLQKLRFSLFKFMLKNSQPADEYLGLGFNHRLTIQTVPVKIG